MAIERSFSSSSIKVKSNAEDDHILSNFVRDDEEIIVLEGGTPITEGPAATNVVSTSTGPTSFNVTWDGELDEDERFQLILSNATTGAQVTEKFSTTNTASFSALDGVVAGTEYDLEILKQKQNDEGEWIDSQGRTGSRKASWKVHGSLA